MHSIILLFVGTSVQRKSQYDVITRHKSNISSSSLSWETVAAVAAVYYENIVIIIKRWYFSRYTGRHTRIRRENHDKLIQQFSNENRNNN